jgi:hypothetical protein
MAHETEHPLAGQTVKIAASEGGRGPGDPGDETEYRLEDWWDRVSGSPWADGASRNPACRNYATRRLALGLPADDEVVYGKIGPFGYLVHVSEIIAVDDEST